MDKNKFVTAYNQLMENMYIAMDDTLHSWADALDIAKDKIHQAGNLTLEEINIISDALHRDVESAARAMPAGKNKNSLTDWFKFDVELLENFALEAFLSLADKTRVQLAELGEKAKHHRYQSGNVTVPGTFECDHCKKQISFKTASEIPACPACHGKTFTRI